LGFLYIDPLKQGLKLAERSNTPFCLAVFIHRSIKTRIETLSQILIPEQDLMFLYIDPLKQGLKLCIRRSVRWCSTGFLYIDPLKQGLKRTGEKFLQVPGIVFIHRSIKTRIETKF